MSVDAWHPSEDELTLSLSGDESTALRAAIADHVQHCDRCRADRDEIAAVLALVSASPAPDAGADFEARMWARIAPAIESVPTRRWSPRQLVPTLAWAAAIGGVVIGGRAMAPSLLQGPTPAPTAAMRPAPASNGFPSAAQERVLLAAVDEHLSQAEMLFVELLNARSASADEMAFVRTTAGDLVSSGRLYRETAQRAGDVPVTLVLDDLETVLVELARTPEAANASDMARLRTRIEGEDLLFKVRAVTLDIRSRQALAQPASLEGAL